MSIDKPKEKWKIETNDRYQQVVGTIISLASGALVLPTLFLKEILPIPKGDTLYKHLTASVFWAWGLLGLSILAGVMFYYFSAKWVKQAWGQKTSLTESCLETLLDFTFGATALLFIVGLLLIIYFVMTFSAHS